MSHTIFFSIYPSSLEEQSQAEAEGFTGLMSVGYTYWEGPLQRGDCIALDGASPLEIKQLIHCPETIAGCEVPHTEVVLEASRVIIDSLIKLDSIWQKFSK